MLAHYGPGDFAEGTIEIVDLCGAWVAIRSSGLKGEFSEYFALEDLERGNG